MNGERAGHPVHCSLFTVHLLLPQPQHAGFHRRLTDWQILPDLKASATKKIDAEANRETRERNIDKVAEKMFKNYPPKS